MNDKNNALFFNEDNDFNAVITLTDEDGNDMDMEAVAALEIHELGKEDDGNIGYLDDISDIIPGVSIDLDN